MCRAYPARGTADLCCASLRDSVRSRDEVEVETVNNMNVGVRFGRYESDTNPSSGGK